MDFLETISKTTLTFFVLLILTRTLGKKQLSQLTFFNYITGITIGSLAANTILNKGNNYLNDMINLIWWTVLTFLVSFLTLKSPKVRTMLEGEPTIVIKNGKILRKALKETGLNLDDLTMLLRDKDVFSIKEVDYAILEPDGKLSVLKKQETGKTRLYVPTEIITDGNLIKRNLEELGLDETWLYEELKAQGIYSVGHVFYAEIQEDGSLHIDKKG